MLRTRGERQKIGRRLSGHGLEKRMNGTGNANQQGATVLHLHSTSELDLTDLPDRLDDQQLATVEVIAQAPLPALPACDEVHFAKCLRVMLAVLPRQATDEIGGELVVATYLRQLGHWPRPAISYLADKATATCRWFPTIAECNDILATWRRWDEASERRLKARAIAARERNARRDEELSRGPAMQMTITQEDVDLMGQQMISLGLSCGALVRDGDKVRPAGAA